MSSQLRSIFIVAMLVGSVAVAGVTFSGVAAAANAPTVEINEVSGTPINGSQSEVIRKPGETIGLNYTISASPDESISDATVTFEAVTDDTVVERSVTADKVTERVEQIGVPTEEGFYEVTLEATDEDGETDSETVRADGLTGFLVVQTEDPTVNVESPSDGDAGGYPMIRGSAYDGAGIDTVTLTIHNPSTGEYWDGSAWVSDWTAIEVANRTPSETYGETVDWNYDVYPHKDAFDAGEYVITANAVDGLGNTLSDPTNTGPPSPAAEEDTAPTSVTFELVVSPAVVESIDFVAPGTTVHEATDDAMTVNVTVAPRGTSKSGLGNATIDSSALGIDAATLTDRTSAGGNVYYEGTVAIGDISVPEGEVTVSATVETSTVPATESASIRLQRAPAAVQTLQVGADFIGIIHDEADAIPVTMDGVVDDDGNPVSTDVGSLSLEIDGSQFASGVSADRNGDVTTDLPIQPATDLGPANTVGQRSIDVVYSETGTTIASFDVRLVHEVYGLEANTYQPAATPMPANDILLESDGNEEVLAWDPSTESWTGVENPTAAGTGYMITPGDDADARLGYEFVTDSSAVETRHEETLSAGTDDGAYHLLGATQTLTVIERTIDTQSEWEADLVDSDTTFASGTNVDVYAPEMGKTLATGQDPPVSWTGADADTLSSVSVNEYGAYWVQLDAEARVDDLTRVFDTEAYSESDREKVLG